MTVLLPSIVLGPVLTNRRFASGEFMKKIMNGQVKVFQTSLAIVDVRDVAMAHVRAMLNEKTNGQRILVS